MLEMIKQLHDRRRGLIESQRQVHARIEASPDGDGVAEAQAQWDALDKDIVELGQRISNLVSMHETSKQAEEQREKFEKMLASPAETATRERDQNDEIVAFMKGGLGENWAPKVIDIKLERHDLTKGVAGAGGNTVPTSFSSRFFEHLVEAAGVRQTNATVIPTTSGETLQVPKTATYGTAAIVNEAAAIPASDPSFGQVSLGAFKYGKLILVSRELLEDTAIDLPAFLAREAGLSIGLANGAHLATGTGTGQPQGVTASATKVGTDGALTTDRLIDLFHSIVTGYRGSGMWLMADATAAVIRKFKETTNQYIWQPGLQAGQPDRLLGRPVVTDPFIPTGGVGAVVVGFGDWSQYYVIRDVASVRFERSDDFRFANDLVAYRALFRTDAKQMLNGATGAVKWLATAA